MVKLYDRQIFLVLITITKFREGTIIDRKLLKAIEIAMIYAVFLQNFWT